MKENISSSFVITEESFNELYNKYYIRLCRFVYYYVKSKDTAEEIVQDVFTEIWARQKSLQVRTNIESYLFIAVKNKAFSKLKKGIKTDTIDALIQTGNRVSQSFDEESFKRKLERVITTLPDKCRLIYSLKYIEGLTTSEIARYLEISEKTVETQIYRALIKLRKQLAPFVTEFYTES